MILGILKGGYHASEWHVLIFSDPKKKWYLLNDMPKKREGLVGLNYLLQGGVTMLRNEGVS